MHEGEPLIHVMHALINGLPQCVHRWDIWVGIFAPGVGI